MIVQNIYIHTFRYYIGVTWKMLGGNIILCQCNHRLDLLNI